jgi:hypothetical protein
MAYETKPNTGSLFVNDKKENEKHPDRTGSINIDGKEYWLNGWLKESAKGVKYLSLSVKPKDNHPTHAINKPDPDDDIF